MISPRQALAVIGATVAAMFVGLAYIIQLSHENYGAGIRILVEAASKQGADANALARRIFLLASGEQVTTFKAAAFGVAIILALIGAVFLMNGASTAYRLAVNQEEGKPGLSGALETSSPGLVIITLSMALAAFTVYSKSSVQDHEDWDLHPTAATATRAKSKADELLEKARKYDQEASAGAAAGAATHDSAGGSSAGGGTSGDKP